MSDEAVLAYCAGVIDSDGYIGVKKNTYAMRRTKDSKQPTYSERVCVKQVEPEAVRLLAKTFAGSLYTAPSQLPGGRSFYVYQISDALAARLLEAVLPFLRIKRRQALNCLSLRAIKERSKLARVAPGRGHAGSAPRPVLIGEEMELAYITAKALNHGGGL